MITLVIVLVIGILIFISSLSYYKKEYSKVINVSIGIEDMKKSEDRIREFMSANNIASTDAISIIGSKLNTFYDKTENITAQAHTRYSDYKKRRLVTLKKGLTKNEMNFAFVHECAHALNEDEVPYERADGTNKPEEEQIIDYMTAALIMPYTDIIEKLDYVDYVNLSTIQRVKFVEKLSKEYSVDNVVVIRRIKEVYKLRKVGYAR